MSAGIDKSAQPGRFEIRGTLGAGGMGIVYRAFDRVIGHEVALKTLRHASGRDLFRFKREFRALADLSHPHLVALHELHTAGDEWFFTMELVDGVPFVEWIRNQRSDNEPTASLSTVHTATVAATRVAAPVAAPAYEPRSLRLDAVQIEDALAQLVDGVLALHASGKLHRDLKPSNVLVTPEGRVVLLDFGLVFDVERASFDMTHDRAAVGTPAYMSPEQAADEPLDQASDWYSVGVILYEALTGRRPFEGSADQIMRHKQAEAPAPPSHRATGVPAHLDELCMRLLARAPRDRPTGRDILTALGRGPSRATLDLERSLAAGPFVGRTAELGMLHQAFVDARQHGVAIFVCGDSGIGKTQVVRHFLDGLDRDVLVLEGRCYERESVPYKTLDSVIDAATSALLRLTDEQLADTMPRDVAALARLFPVLRRVPLIDERSTGAIFPPDPQELRRRAFGALRHLLRRLTELERVVIAIDDLQWGDLDSAGFLAELIHHPEPVRLLLVLVHRPEDDAGVVDQVRVARSGLPEGDTRTIVVSAFDDRDARTLVHALGGADTTAETLVREGGGHPLFLAELARASGELQTVASLEQLIARRIAVLPPSAAALLRATAAATRPVPVHHVARAARLAGFGEELALLRAERLVRVRHRGDADLAFVEPYHDRIRAAALATVSPDALREIHEALAVTFEASGLDTDLEGLVEHWLAAGKPEHAASHALRAAAVAEQMLAFHRAAELYGIALRHGDGDAMARRQLLRLRAVALSHGGDLAESARVFAEAALGAPDDEALELDCLRLEQLLRRGALGEGLALAKETLARVGVAISSDSGAALRAAIVERIRLRLRGLDFVERDVSQVPPATLRRLDTLYSTASGLAFIKPIVGRALQFRFLRECLDAGEPVRLTLAMSMELGYLGQTGVSARHRIEALISRLSKISARNLDPALSGIATACEGLAVFLMGRWREGRRLLEAGRKSLRDHATARRWEITLADLYAAFSLFYVGDTRELVRMVPLLLADAIDRGDVYAQRGLRSSRSNITWLVMGRPGEARAHVEDVARVSGIPSDDGFHLQHYFELLALTQIDLYEGNVDAAWDRLQAQWKPLLGSHLLRIQNIRVEMSYLRARVLLARAARTSGAARQASVREVRTLARRLDGERADWASAFAEQLRAVAALLAGSPADAERLLESAERRYAALDMNLHATLVRLRLGQLVGGANGDAWAAGARQHMLDQAIADPDAMARMLCPWPEAQA